MFPIIFHLFKKIRYPFKRPLDCCIETIMGYVALILEIVMMMIMMMMAT
jgi:hypothetical protein